MVARDQGLMYNTSHLVKNKLMAGAPPFSGQTKNMAPRVPPPFFYPVPKEASRVDWRGSTSAVFKTPGYRKAFKRIHQLVYGTPTALARRGGLQVDWGHQMVKGYPILHRPQSWLPGLQGSRHQMYDPTNGKLTVDETAKVQHFNLGSVLAQRQRVSNFGNQISQRDQSGEVRFQ